jgi:hypothetical protein
MHCPDPHNSLFTSSLHNTTPEPGTISTNHHDLTPDERALIAAYVSIGRTLDDLPYTDDFERLIAHITAPPLPPPDRRATILTLQRLRKSGKGRLPSVGRESSPPPKVTADDESLLASLVVELAGSLGARDSLLYDPRFDTLVERFNAATARTLTPHDAWRLIAKLAK